MPFNCEGGIHFVCLYSKVEQYWGAHGIARYDNKWKTDFQSTLVYYNHIHRNEYTLDPATN